VNFICGNVGEKIFICGKNCRNKKFSFAGGKIFFCGKKKYSFVGGGELILLRKKNSFKIKYLFSKIYEFLKKFDNYI